VKRRRRRKGRKRKKKKENSNKKTYTYTHTCRACRSASLLSKFSFGLFLIRFAWSAYLNVDSVSSKLYPAGL
jgi:hypothetical protein